MKRTGRGEMTWPAGAYRGFHDHVVVVQQIGFLLREIQLDRVLRETELRQISERQKDNQKSFHVAAHRMLTGVVDAGSLAEPCKRKF